MNQKQVNFTTTFRQKETKFLCDMLKILLQSHSLFWLNKRRIAPPCCTHKTPTNLLWFMILFDLKKSKNLDKSTFVRHYFLMQQAKIIKFEMEGSIG